MSIESDPPGARLMLDGIVVGTTPYEAEFVFYGERRVDLELAGYEWLQSTANVIKPWWQNFPIDAFTDLFWPFETLDEHSFRFTLVPVSGDSSSFEDAKEAYRRLKERFGDIRDENEDDRLP